MPMNSASTKRALLFPPRRFRGAVVDSSWARKGGSLVWRAVPCIYSGYIICCRYSFFAAGFTEGAAVRVAPEKIVVKDFLTFARTGGGFPRGSARMELSVFF